MPASAEFCEFLTEQLAGFGPVEIKRMFGGAGLFRDGLMFALVADDVLFFKVDEENTGAFEAEDLPHFTYTTKKGDKGLMSYRRAPERCLDDADDMTEWARAAFDAAPAHRCKEAQANSEAEKIAFNDPLAGVSCAPHMVNGLLTLQHLGWMSE